MEIDELTAKTDYEARELLYERELDAFRKEAERERVKWRRKGRVDALLLAFLVLVLIGIIFWNC